MWSFQLLHQLFQLYTASQKYRHKLRSNTVTRVQQMRSTGNHWRQKYFNWRLETPRFNDLIIIHLYGFLNDYKPEKGYR